MPRELKKDVMDNCVFRMDRHDVNWGPRGDYHIERILKYHERGDSPAVIVFKLWGIPVTYTKKSIERTKESALPSFEDEWRSKQAKLVDFVKGVIAKNQGE